MNPLFSQSNMELTFILLFYVDKMGTPWGNNSVARTNAAHSPVSLPFIPTSTAMQKKKYKVFSNGELCKSSTDDLKALIET